MENLYQGLNELWAKRDRENKLNALRQKAIAKGFRPPDKMVKAVKAVKAEKVTKQDLFLQIVKANPGIAMRQASKMVDGEKWGGRTYFNFFHKLENLGLMYRGAVKSGKGEFGLYCNK